MLLTFLNILATIIGVISLLIVTYGVFVGFIAFLRNEFKRINGTYTINNVRQLRADFGEIARKTDELLERLDFTRERNTMVQSLPLGWKQKLAFSVSIFHDPAIVFLDEPTGGVDPYTRRQFWEMIYEAADRGITVFVTTHYMDEAEYCDRVSIMVDGRIDALDTPHNLKERFGARSMEEVFQALARKAERTE